MKLINIFQNLDTERLCSALILKIRALDEQELR